MRIIILLTLFSSSLSTSVFSHKRSISDECPAEETIPKCSCSNKYGGILNLQAFFTAVKITFTPISSRKTNYCHPSKLMKIKIITIIIIMGILKMTSYCINAIVLKTDQSVFKITFVFLTKLHMHLETNS